MSHTPIPIPIPISDTYTYTYTSPQFDPRWIPTAADARIWACVHPTHSPPPVEPEPATGGGDWIPGRAELLDWAAACIRRGLGLAHDATLTAEGRHAR